MTQIVNIVRTIEEVRENKVEDIIKRLREIGFLGKREAEVKIIKLLDGELKLIHYRPGPNFFNYLVLKEETSYGVYSEESIKDYENFCDIEVGWEMPHHIGYDAGNNIIALSHCGDCFENFSPLISELEQLTGDEYVFEEEVF